MHIQVNTGNGLPHTESLVQWADGFLNESLARFAQEITRVELQLSDENRARKGAADIRCMLEARLIGHEPVAVSHHAPSQDEAIRGATTRLIHALEHALGRLDRQRHRERETIRKDVQSAPAPDIQP